MGITTPILAGEGLMPIAKTAPFAVNFHSGNFSALAPDLNEEIKAAPGAGKAIYISHVTMGVVGASATGWVMDTTLTLVDGAGTDMFGPIQFQAQGGSFMSKDFDPPLKVTDNKALDVTGVGAGEGSYFSAALVYIEGFTGQKPI